MPLCYDLHTHSSASDGALTPADLVARAREKGVQRLALTDHDTLSGLDEAARAAKAADIELVPGIELSVRWANRELHMLALWVDVEAPALTALVDRQAGAREVRARKMGHKLDKAAGLANSYERACALAGSAVPGRPWFARMLVEQGRARNIQHAFNRFLKQGQSGFVATPWVELAEAVSVVCAAGGIAAIAHPTRYGLTRRKLRQLLRDFTGAGGQGLESAMPGMTRPQHELVAECLRDFNLAASGGSDFHSPEQRWLELGRLPELPQGATPVWELVA
jgi:predicted metal-dependent phosphoesterase TrpH